MTNGRMAMDSEERQICSRCRPSSDIVRVVGSKPSSTIILTVFTRRVENRDWEHLPLQHDHGTRESSSDNNDSLSYFHQEFN